jgi:hypothetical protein
MIGSVLSISPDEHDVRFSIVAGSEYEVYHGMLVSRCEIAPIVDGKPAWEYAFTVPGLREIDIESEIDGWTL